MCGAYPVYPAGGYPCIANGGGGEANGVGATGGAGAIGLAVGKGGGAGGGGTVGGRPLNIGVGPNPVGKLGGYIGGIGG